MRRFYVSDGHNPLVWPVPDGCVWNADHVDTNGEVRIAADTAFENEADALRKGLEDTGVLKVSDNGRAVVIKLTEAGDSGLGSEDYQIRAQSACKLGDDHYLVSAKRAGSRAQGFIAGDFASA